MRWHVPQLLTGLRDAPEVYFDSISRVRVPAWSSGRAALIGDAAWGVTLGGMGVGTGIVGAYVLAGELAAARGDHRPASPPMRTGCAATPPGWQRSANPGQFLAPPTASRLSDPKHPVRHPPGPAAAGHQHQIPGHDVDLPDYVPLTSYVPS